ncbi:eIF3 subunit 6 N terminal domain-containing protein [Dipodascopsis tothii]|uniref:eIF3 subunit 6 N terminal domain-containing protein n=1 Tax=Dipodascopsis tothii TaxID=44089 RepID=UPI0034D0142B
MPTETVSAGGEFDLVSKVLPYLDRLLIFALLEHMSEVKLYPESALLELKYAVMKDTDMVTYLAETYSALHQADADSAATKAELAQIAARKDSVLATLRTFEETTRSTLEILREPELAQHMKTEKAQNIAYMKSTHGFTDAQIVDLYNYGQAQYNCGKYAEAAELLGLFRGLSLDSELVSSATWGKFACSVMTVQWDAAVEELAKVREILDTRSSVDPLVLLNQRTWLIHWSLFFFFNGPAGRAAVAELFLAPAYVNTIQTSCPWVLRYLTVAILTNTSLRTASSSKSARASQLSYQQYQKQVKELVRVIRQEQYEYRDPITEFVYALYVDFDFEEAQNKLVELEAVVRHDPFLVGCADEFLESARYVIAELYCQIHQRIDIKDLSARLNLSHEEGEKWIVNLIRDTRVDAKINFAEGTVIMNHPPVSVYQQVIERTKGLSFRTSQMLAHVLSARSSAAAAGRDDDEAEHDEE